MDVGLYLRFAIALALVLALIAGAAWAARKLGLAGAGPVIRKGRRLGVSESLAIDTKRRLVLVKRDGAEHLILLGPNADLLIESTGGAGDEAPMEAETAGGDP